MKYDVYGIGTALLDIEFLVSSKFLKKNNIYKGITTLINEERKIELLKILKKHSFYCKKKHIGGSLANSLVAINYFKGTTFFSFNAINDSLGKYYIKKIKKIGIHCNKSKNICSQNGKTGNCLIFITEDSDRTMNTFVGTSNELNENNINFDALFQSKYLFIEGYLIASKNTYNLICNIIIQAKLKNIKIALTLSDVSIIDSFREKIDNIIENGIDLIFCNQFEAKAYTKTNSLKKLIFSMKKNCKTFVITFGKDGSIVFDGDNLYKIPANNVKKINTLGAGDVYAGTFLAGITQGVSWKKSAEFATKTSAKIVTRYGSHLLKNDFISNLKLLN